MRLEPESVLLAVSGVVAALANVALDNLPFLIPSGIGGVPKLPLVRSKATRRGKRCNSTIGALAVVPERRSFLEIV